MADALVQSGGLASACRKQFGLNEPLLGSEGFERNHKTPALQ